MPVKLYPHQLEALERLRSGFILRGEVGSGKTLTSLAYYYVKECHGVIKLDGNLVPPETFKPLYIITTAMKRNSHDWDKEMLAFGLSTDIDISYKHTPVVVDSWNNIKKYTDVKDAFFIFDEHRISSGTGAWSRTFEAIAKQNHWLLLTATPGDRWLDYVAVFVANGFYRNYTQFCNEHVVWAPFIKYKKVSRYVGVDKLLRLRNQITVNMSFLRKTTRHHIDIQVNYDRHLSDQAYMTRFDPEAEEPFFNASDLCMFLRKVANRDPSRIVRIKEILAEKHKAIIFYNFNFERDLLRQMCAECGIVENEWNGEKHELVPVGDEWVYLVQYTAGAEGWNCVTTDTIIFYSQSYSYKQMEQASGRIDRLNTPYTDLYYYHLMSSSPIDIAIKKALDKKEDFNELDLVQRVQKVGKSAHLKHPS